MKKLLVIFALVLACAAQSVAQDNNVRHIDFTQVLNGLDGKPVMGGDAKNPTQLTLSDVAITALETPLEEDRGLTGKAKFELDDLARRVYRNKSAVLSPEDQTLLKDRIARLYGPLVVGVAWRLIDQTVK